MDVTAVKMQFLQQARCVIHKIRYNVIMHKRNKTSRVKLEYLV